MPYLDELWGEIFDVRLDTALDTAGHPITDVLNADNTVDVSLTSGRAVGTATA